MKTILKLKKNTAAIVFSSNGCQLVFPTDSEMTPPVALATSLILALQHDTFLNYLAAFTNQLARETEGAIQEVTH